MIGTISNIIPAKKFGFISAENGQEYFFHMADMESGWEDLVGRFNLEGGGKIKASFTPVKTQKGPRAREVIVLEE